MSYIKLQRGQHGNVDNVWDFNVVYGQHGKGIYCFMYGNPQMKDYYTRQGEMLHTFTIDKKYLYDLSNQPNMDYWSITSFIYNHPQYKAFIFQHKGYNIPTAKEILITDPSIILL